MEKTKHTKDRAKVPHTDWVDSLQSIVDRTESNLKGIGSTEDEPVYNPKSPTIPCCDEHFSPQRTGLEHKTLLSKFISFLNFIKSKTLC